MPHICVNSVFYTGTRDPRAARLNLYTVDTRRKASKDITLAGVNHLIEESRSSSDDNRNDA